MSKYLNSLALVCALMITVSAQAGKITGKLTYPGDGIPADLVLCLESVSAAAVTTCSNEPAARLRAAGSNFKISYRRASFEATLPSGTYYIYAKTAEMRGVRAYYDEFVKCGMDIKCRSKKPIAIKVRPGQIVKGVIVGDFWD